MKANQAFRNEDEAVSPVIGVILMVAITVVLAAVVFILVQNLGSQSAGPDPQVTYKKTESSLGGTLTILNVVNAPAGGMAWDTITWTGDATCDSASLTGNVTAGDEVDCAANGDFNMVFTPPGGTAVVVASGRIN